MKLRIIGLILTICTLFICLTACKNSQNNTETPPETSATETTLTTEEPQFAQASSAFLYENLYFYQGSYYYGGTLKYQNIDDMKDRGIPVFNDTSTEDPFSNKLGDVYMVVDKQATKENGGAPVLLIAHHLIDDPVTEDWTKNYKLISLNTQTKEITTLAEDLGTTRFHNFWLYGDTIYFSLWDRPAGASPEDPETYTMHTISRSGGEIKKLNVTFENAEYPRILGIYNDKIYYTTWVNPNLDLDEADPDVIKNTIESHKLWVSDLNFENREFLMTLDQRNLDVYIDNGYLYYADNYEVVSIDKHDNYYADIYRKPLEGFKTAKPELLLEKVNNAAGNGDKIAYSLKGDTQMYQYYTFWLPKYLTVRLYDINSKESEILLNSTNDSEAQDFSVSSINENYLNFYTADNKNKFYNMKTGEITVFPGIEV